MIVNCYRCGRDTRKGDVCGWCTGESRPPISRSKPAKNAAKHAQEMLVDDAINAMRNADDADLDYVDLNEVE